MRITRACALSISALLGAAMLGPAYGFEVELAGRKLSLEAPEGYCALEQAQPRDKVFLDRLSLALGDDYLLLLMFADCEELKQYRAKRAERFLRFGQIMAMRERGAPIAALAGFSRNTYSAQATANFGRLTDPAAQREALARLHQEIGEGRVAGQRIIGLLDRDGAGAYLGLIARNDTPGEPQILAGISAATLLREIRLSINLYRRYEDAQSLPALLADQKRIVARLIEKNGETIEPVPADEPPLAQADDAPKPAPGAQTPGARADGFSWTLLAAGLALLAAIGAGLVLVLRNKRR